ncbi:MAG: hypothetical protein JWM16_4920 [Verrucomicrobiales bacterium]|nr:hypothetical protein [Verrucomicrobiales bacterium]
MRSGENLREEERTVAWFYRVLRYNVIDFYRRQATARKMLDIYSAEDPSGTMPRCVNVWLPC